MFINPVKFLKSVMGTYLTQGKIINNDLGKTENDKQNSAFEHCRDKRNKTDNKTLDNRDEQRRHNKFNW